MPFKSQRHIDVLLSNISIKYRPQGYIGMQVFPELPVKKDSDLFRVYDRDFRMPETQRANGAISNEADFFYSTSTYALKKHSQKGYVTDDDADNYDISDLRADKTEHLTDIILRRMELDVASLFTSTNWSQNMSLSAAQQFDGTTTANPIPIFDTAATTVLQQSGFAVNYGIMTRTTFIKCKNNAQVLDRTKYTSKEMTPAILSGLLDLPELLIANGVYDTAAPGVSSNITEIWGDNCFVGFKPSRPSPLVPSSGYVFRKNIPMTKRWRVEERDAEAIEVNQKYDVRVVASLSGFLMKDVLA